MAQVCFAKSLSLYMYQNPKRAKKLYPDVVPKAVDEYLSYIEKFENQRKKKTFKSSMAYSWRFTSKRKNNYAIFNAIKYSGIWQCKKKDVLWKFIKSFIRNRTKIIKF